MDTATETRLPIIDVICVTYHQTGPLKVLVQSFLNQSAKNWRLTVIHDGLDTGFKTLMKDFMAQDPQRISFTCTDRRYNDYGHSLREMGLKKVTGDYVLLTNGDNYYVPVFIELLTRKILETNADAIMFDMVHSHDQPGGRNLPPYSHFICDYKRYHIDMGAAIIRTRLAKLAGFRDKNADGDATYFEDVARHGGMFFKIAKISQVLLVHN